MRLDGLLVSISMTLSLGACADHGTCEGNCPASDCQGALSEISADCPKMFDGAQFPTCQGLLGQSVFECELLIQLLLSGVNSSVSCFYDSTSHSLVGARRSSNVPEFCDNKSDTMSAGMVCSMYPYIAVNSRDCSGQDAGTN